MFGKLKNAFLSSIVERRIRKFIKENLGETVLNGTVVHIMLPSNGEAHVSLKLDAKAVQALMQHAKEKGIDLENAELEVAEKV